MALPIALGILMVLSISVVAVIELSSSGARNANRSKESESAFNIAEAGLAEAFSVLEQAANPTTVTLSTTTRSLGNGTYTYSGTYVMPTWTITSKGSVPSPSGGADVTRTLSQTATVQPLVPGATPPEWDRLFHNRTDICLTIDTVTVPASVTSAGDLCLVGTGKITGARSGVEVGDDVTIASTYSSTLSITRSAGGGTSSGSPAWTSMTNLASSDNNRASNTNIPVSSDGGTLDATTFGFSGGSAVPSGAQIMGIEARIERHGSGSSVRDVQVSLLKNGLPVGSNKAVTGSDWPSGSSNEAERTYGSSSDLWGTTWTPTDINSPANFGLRLRVHNNSSSSLRTANVDRIRLIVSYRTETISGSIGQSGANISRAEIVGTCQKGSTGPANSPCTTLDNVYANTNTQNPPNLQKPQVDMQYWYDNAKPGPNHNCTTGSFPGGFDNNTLMDNSLPDYGNGNEDIDQLTPSFITYSCKVIENGQTVGELSWNHLTHVLTIKGTIFIDGNVRFDKDGTLVNYNGRAIMYAGGDLEFDEVVCAGGNGTNNCWAGDMTAWDPEQNMLIILSRGWSEYDQGDNLEPAAFQGVMYAQGHCQIHQAFRSSGPIICDEIRIENTDGQWPTFYAWPELQSLIAGQMYGSFSNADDYALILGDEVG